MVGFTILLVGMCGLEYGNLIHCEANEIFSGRQPRQNVKVFWYIGSTNTKPPVHPEDGDGISSRNVGKPSHPDAAVCPRKSH